MKRTITVAVISLLCAAGVAGIQSSSPASDPAAGPTPQDLVALRRNGMLMSANIIGAMKDGAEGGDVRGQRFAARAVARWAEVMPPLFAPGTDAEVLPQLTEARPEIWSDQAGFARKVADYKVATVRLAELAGEGDQAAFLAQWAVMRETCNSCHSVYKAERPRS